MKTQIIKNILSLPRDQNIQWGSTAIQLLFEAVSELTDRVAALEARAKE